MDVKERRRAPRISVSLPVTFQTQDGSVHTGTVENLSETGMLLVTNTDVPQETDVRIMFGDYDASHAIEVSGSVVRSSPVGEFGISFIELSPRAVDAIRTAMTRDAD